ncbi:hypothetical protein ACFSX9_11785 [Flavobacterium ardleyense]|uniref:Uncharacterized protein n=1 Tax=Flavobacterium ardleyense TaxID=2038737 RepID=A0ABW5Z954_9FLAO
MNKAVTLLTLLFSVITFAQTKIDEHITVKFPGEPQTFEDVTKSDTLNQNYQSVLNAYYLNSDQESYVVLRVSVVVNDDLEPDLPASKKELLKNYKNFVTQHITDMAQKNLLFKDSTQIMLNDLIAYKITFKASDSEEENGESLLLFANGISYVFIYSKVDSYSKGNKEKFFKSIAFTNSKAIKQIAEPFNYWGALLKLISSVFLIFFAVKLIRKQNSASSSSK